MFRALLATTNIATSSRLTMDLGRSDGRRPRSLGTLHLSMPRETPRSKAKQQLAGSLSCVWGRCSGSSGALPASTVAAQRGESNQ